MSDYSDPKDPNDQSAIARFLRKHGDHITVEEECLYRTMMDGYLFLFDKKDKYPPVAAAVEYIRRDLLGLRSSWEGGRSRFAEW